MGCAVQHLTYKYKEETKQITFQARIDSHPEEFNILHQIDYSVAEILDSNMVWGSNHILCSIPMLFEDIPKTNRIFFLYSRPPPSV